MRLVTATVHLFDREADSRHGAVVKDSKCPEGG